MRHSEVTLDDKYLLEDGRAFITGVQALIRVMLDRRRLDVRDGLNTAGYVSGYRGSPLGGLDQQAARSRKLLTAHEVVFQEGLNEDLAATAVWGSQQANLFPGARFDGVYGLWYGKAPGVDRTGDVFKHANFAGVMPRGGVLAIAGDDHNCKSSTLPSQSEFAFQDFEMPVLSPADVQEVLDYGLLGISMSRFSGLWVGMIALADTMDSAPGRAAHPHQGPAAGEGDPSPQSQDPGGPGLRPRQQHRQGGAGRPPAAPRHRLPGPGLQGCARSLPGDEHHPR
jgi:indolepyruvate ferredoxin oxidoreductase